MIDIPIPSEAARFNEQSLHTKPRQSFNYRSGGEFVAVIRSDMLWHAANTLLADLCSKLPSRTHILAPKNYLSIHLIGRGMGWYNISDGQFIHKYRYTIVASIFSCIRSAYRLYCWYSSRHNQMEKVAGA